MNHVTEKEWITAAGLRAVCLIIRGSHRCGYVEVYPEHPLYGVEYNEETDALRLNPEEVYLGKKSPVLPFIACKEDGSIRKSPEVAFDVHGGLTFSGKGGHYPADGNGWWFGFDCAHYNDGYIEGSEMAQYQFNSEAPVRTLEYVEQECESLAQQIKEMFS